MNLMKRAILYDVVVIRLILIVLLVLYHSFAIYNGAWSIPEGIHEVKSYWWLASFAYSFMLEAFVFISGYVWGYQVRTKYDGIVDFNTTVVKKAKRLLIPSVIFSFIYLICFNWNNSMTWGGADILCHKWSRSYVVPANVILVFCGIVCS